MSRKLRVLVVEDEAIIAMTAEDMLDMLGHSVTTIASDLDQAMAAAEGDGFDVAMLDINLHGKQSLPVADLLAERGKPFIFTTGYGSSGRPDHHAHVPVVTKPYGADALGAAILRVAGG